MKFSWEIRWNFSSKISAATGFCRDILIRFRCGRISRKGKKRVQNWRRSLSFAKYVIGVLVTRRVIERDRRSCGRAHRSARFDFNKLRSADHLCPLCLHRPSNFNPANFRIYSRDGGLKPLNRERNEREALASVDGLSPESIIRTTLSTTALPRPSPVDFNFSDPAHTHRPSIVVIIIPYSIPVFYNCHGNSSLRSIHIPFFIPTPVARFDTSD